MANSKQSFSPDMIGPPPSFYDPQDHWDYQQHPQHPQHLPQPPPPPQQQFDFAYPAPGASYDELLAQFYPQQQVQYPPYTDVPGASNSQSNSHPNPSANDSTNANATPAPKRKRVAKKAAPQPVPAYSDNSDSDDGFGAFGGGAGISVGMGGLGVRSKGARLLLSFLSPPSRRLTSYPSFFDPFPLVQNSQMAAHAPTMAIAFAPLLLVAPFEWLSVRLLAFAPLLTPSTTPAEDAARAGTSASSKAFSVFLGEARGERLCAGSGEKEEAERSERRRARSVLALHGRRGARGVGAGSNRLGQRSRSGARVDALPRGGCRDVWTGSFRALSSPFLLLAFWRHSAREMSWRGDTAPVGEDMDMDRQTARREAVESGV
ncbi:hypothetical protein DFH09DRAFT_1366462 [Mycena vulgaris]|nr:hypothetical protein DFH09DRAFT_1366462 [Mycena vulgaris]